MIEQFLAQGLHKWPKPLKIFLVAFLFLLTSGVTVGLVFLFMTTSLSVTGTIEHYNGSDVSTDDTFSIQEKYAKPVSEMLLTTHNHLIGFSFIFIILGMLFYFNTIINGQLKNFLIVEPLISAWVTFASLWGIRFIGTYFIYVSMTAAVLTYLSFYLLVGVLIYELLFKTSS